LTSTVIVALTPSKVHFGDESLWDNSSWRAAFNCKFS